MILIEKDLTFVSVPRCASMSVHYMLEESGLNIEPTYNSLNTGYIQPSDDGEFSFTTENNHKINSHLHVSLARIYDFLGYQPESFLITRDYGERFLSCFNYLFNFWLPINIYNLFDDRSENFADKMVRLDNDFIYKVFTKDVINKILIADVNFYEKSKKINDEVHKTIVTSMFDICEIKNRPQLKLGHPIYFKMLDSQLVWRSGIKPTYTFDIGEINQLKIFLQNRYNKEINVKRINRVPEYMRKTNVVLDQKLRDWIWNNFEKYHHTKKFF